MWRLAWALTTFHRRQGHLSTSLECWLLALDAAGQIDDAALQQRTHRLLGRAHARVGRRAEGLGHLHRSLELAEYSGDVAEQAHSHLALARADDDRPALAHAVRSLELYRDLDEPVWQATALNQIGVLSALTGEYDQARTACEAALVLHRQHGNRDGEANTLGSLGRLSDGDDAVRHFEQRLGPVPGSRQHPRRGRRPGPVGAVA